MRNGALLRRISGVSQKMLIETLRELEGLDLVERTVYEKVPPHVEHRLTPLGESLSSVVAQLDRWVERHMDQLGARSQKPAQADSAGDSPRFERASSRALLRA